MVNLFEGPVELSENPNHWPGSKWIGTTLRLPFQVKELPEVYPNPDNSEEYIYPEVIIRTRYVKTWAEWQQHEVRLNNFLIGTIRNHPSPQTHPLDPDWDPNAEPPDEKIFRLKFQPKILQITPVSELYLVPQDKVNVLSVEMGTGGFGLNDSFIIDSIDLENIVTNFG